MTKNIATSFIISSLFVLIGCSQSALTEIAWHRNDLGTAFNQAARAGKPILVDVYADWCNTCKKMSAETYTDANVIQASAQFVSLKFNPETTGAEGEAFAERYGILGFPTTLFLDSAGNVIGRHKGFLEATALTGKMNDMAGVAGNVDDYKASYDAGDKDAGKKLLAIYLDAGRIDDALSVYAEVEGSLSAEQQAKTHVKVAQRFYLTEEYTAAIEYADVVEADYAETEYIHEARSIKGASLNYTEGKDTAIAYLTRLANDAATPDGWKANYENLLEQIKNASE